MEKKNCTVSRYRGGAQWLLRLGFETRVEALLTLFKKASGAMKKQVMLLTMRKLLCL